MGVKIAIRKCTDVCSCTTQMCAAALHKPFGCLAVHVLCNYKYVPVNVDSVPKVPTKMKVQYSMYLFSHSV
jgi:hypothetical protein